MLKILAIIKIARAEVLVLERVRSISVPF